MGSLEIIEDNKTYDSENDVWIDKYDRIFIKNQFIPNAPVFIHISHQYWFFRSSGKGYIDWTTLRLPESIESAFKIAIRKKLKLVSYSYLNKCRCMLAEFSAGLEPEWSSLSDLKMSDINKIWQNMTISYRSFLRELYTYLASQNIGGASNIIAAKLQRMNARTETRALKDILNWHPTRGALTQEEENILRNAIETRHSESIRAFGIRLYCWLLIATLKRGMQIRELHADCLKIIEKNRVEEYFVLIEPVKNQTGDPKRWWPITKALYHEMQRYSSDCRVRKLQLSYDRFWVFDCHSLHRYGVVSAADARIAILNYVQYTLGLISPRTGKPLHITSTRIRHSGATRLAYKGVSRDIISEILEHDDPASCQAYIDAVGSELCPSLDKADRNMGSLFIHLNRVYFEGKVVDELTEQPIVIPDFSEPTSTSLFVGSCARDTCKEGLCHKHPFIGCYNGCSSFLAWREADHHRALLFADKELERWRKASGHAAQASTIKEYEELKNNILDVIQRIEQLMEVS